MGITFWAFAIIIICITTGVIFYKPYLGIAFIIVSIPFEGKVSVDSFHFYPLEVIMVILISVYIFKILVKKSNDYKNVKLVFCYLPFMLCILLSSSKFMELSLTIKEIVRWLELIIIYFLTINLINDHKKMRVILCSMVLTTSIVSIWGIINYLLGVVTIDEKQGAFSFFGHPNALAGYINLIIPVLFGMLMTGTILWKRITIGTITVLAIITWFLTFSKSGWLSLIITTVVIVIFLAKAKKGAIFFLVILIMSFVLIFLSSKIKHDSLYSLGATRTTLGNRIQFYPIGFNMVKDDIFFGIGVGNYSLLIKEFTDKHTLIQTNLHNLYLQVFVEVGLLGFCAFLFWLTVIIKYLVISLKLLKQSRKYDLFVGLMGGVIVFLLGNIANVLTVHGIHLQWGIILGLAVLLTQFRESETCLKKV